MGKVELRVRSQTHRLKIIGYNSKVWGHAEEEAMWTVENRRRYNRDTLRYPSDLTPEEWGLVEPLIRPAKPGGNRRRVKVREVMNGIL